MVRALTSESVVWTGRCCLYPLGGSYYKVFSTFVYEDAQDPSECELSLTPKYPEENLPLSYGRWSCI